ncbi:MAG: hypothetical protein NVS4B12_12160 [Ktedonobacteraceae bacterium]
MTITRPRGLILVILVEALLGVLSLVGGVTSLSLHSLPQPQGLGFLQVLAPVLPSVMIVLGMFFLVLCFGLWMGYRWAWTMTIIFELVHIIADIGFIASRSFAVDKIIGLIIIIGTLYYLTRPTVRAYFHTTGLPSQQVVSE